MSGLSRFIAGFKSGTQKHRELMNDLAPEPQVSGRMAFLAISIVVVALIALASWLEFAPHGTLSRSSSGGFLMPLATFFIFISASAATLYGAFHRRQRKKDNRISDKNT